MREHRNFLQIVFSNYTYYSDRAFEIKIETYTLVRFIHLVRCSLLVCLNLVCMGS